jgi:hypothetical protein
MSKITIGNILAQFAILVYQTQAYSFYSIGWGTPVWDIGGYIVGSYVSDGVSSITSISVNQGGGYLYAIVVNGI